MPVFNFPFAGGITGIDPWGQMSIVQFGSTWLPDEKWTVKFTSNQAPKDFTTGVGYMDAQTPTTCYAYQKRVYVGFGSRFNFSAIDEEGASQYLQWEIQNVGAGFLPFTSQYGNQDLVQAFSQVQGRLAVLGSQSVQLWTVDPDPAQFALGQILDNSGTNAKESPANLGDYDALFLDQNGVRNLKTHMDTLNSFVDDIGVAIFETLQQALKVFPVSGVCAIVEPNQKQYWIYIGGNIYVLARYLGASITAWATFVPTDQNGIPFAPQKFVVFDKQVYCRAVGLQMIQYGGVDRKTYDSSVVTVELPWLDDTRPGEMKMSQRINAAIEGKWIISASMDPMTWEDVGNLFPIYQSEITGGTEDKDSTFDLLNISYSQKGTHLKVVFQTHANWDRRARVSEFLFHYNRA